MAYGDARERKWRGNKGMEWVTSKSHMTAEHRLVRAVQTLQAVVYNSAASSRLNWRPRRFKWTRPFRRKRRNLVSAHVPSHFKRSLTTGLTVNNFAFCPHSVFKCFVFIWEQTAIISLYSINWLLFITETECVYCAVRTGSLKKIQGNFTLRNLTGMIMWPRELNSAMQAESSSSI